MALEKSAEIMARCWAHMIKTGVISSFIQKANPEKAVLAPTVSKIQEDTLIKTLKENFIKTINAHPERFETTATGLSWSLFSPDVANAMKEANISIDSLHLIKNKNNPHIHMNNYGQLTISNGWGGHFLYYPESPLSLPLRFNSKPYLELLEDFCKNYIEGYGARQDILISRGLPLS